MARPAARPARCGPQRPGTGPIPHAAAPAAAGAYSSQDGHRSRRSKSGHSRRPQCGDVPGEQDGGSDNRGQRVQALTEPEFGEVVDIEVCTQMGVRAAADALGDRPEARIEGMQRKHCVGAFFRKPCGQSPGAVGVLGCQQPRPGCRKVVRAGRSGMCPRPVWLWDCWTAWPDRV